MSSNGGESIADSCESHETATLKPEFVKEYEKMVDQYYRAVKKNKENERRISALNGELAFYRSQDVEDENKSITKQYEFKFSSEFPATDYRACQKLLLLHSPCMGQ